MSEHKIVSIRCRRHKKRFNVEETWLETSRWLCPKCYESLSSHERQRYAPVQGEVEVRDAETGKPTMVPAKKHYNGARRAKDKLAESKPGPSVEEVSMQCIFCGKNTNVPTAEYIKEHLFCPECVNMLNTWDRMQYKQEFITKRSARYADIEREFRRVLEREREKHEKANANRNLGETPYEMLNGCCSNSTIMSMSIPELIKAVKDKRISKVRAKIELKRRKRHGYYNSLPDYNPVKPIFG